MHAYDEEPRSGLRQEMNRINDENAHSIAFGNERSDQVREVCPSTSSKRPRRRSPRQ